MTREEAIKMLKYMLKYNSNVIRRTINGKTDPNEVAALDMAIKALEKESTEITAKEADNVRNSYLAIKATPKQSCEPCKSCKYCEDIAMAFQFGLLFGKADKAIEEVKKPATPQPKMGRWIDEKDGYGTRCSECGKWYSHSIITKQEVLFCSSCGAKMQEVEK